jgi:putative methyltransferase (TIGR04325 family)
MKKLIKELIPPLLLRKWRGQSRYGWFGDYATWSEARAASTGYDGGAIIDKVGAALLKVKNGEAVYERDSVLFDEVQYSWPLLSALLWVASLRKGRLRVVDFGGSLGSSYFQNRSFLAHLDELRWTVVEQAAFVERGKRDFEGPVLRFQPTLEAAIADDRPDLLLLSSVLSYLEDPWALLDAMLAKGIPHVVIDLTGFMENGRERITVQRVPPEIYEASYPCRFLSREGLLARFSRDYELKAAFPCELNSEFTVDGDRGRYEGFIFTRKV